MLIRPLLSLPFQERQKVARRLASIAKQLEGDKDSEKDRYGDSLCLATLSLRSVLFVDCYFARRSVHVHTILGMLFPVPPFTHNMVNRRQYFVL